jgi:hypothetical protein
MVGNIALMTSLRMLSGTDDEAGLSVLERV